MAMGGGEGRAEVAEAEVRRQTSRQASKAGRAGMTARRMARSTRNGASEAAQTAAQSARRHSSALTLPSHSRVAACRHGPHVTVRGCSSAERAHQERRKPRRPLHGPRLRRRAPLLSRAPRPENRPARYIYNKYFNFLL